MTTTRTRRADRAERPGEHPGEAPHQEPKPEVQPELHMVRTELDLERLNHWMNTRGMQDQGHALHSLLVETFGDLAPHPFRALTGERKRNQSLLGYTRAEADTLNGLLGAFTDPLQDQILIPGTLESKPMAHHWKQGDRLGFEVLVRPIVRPSARLQDEQPEIRAAMEQNGIRPNMEIDAFRWETIVKPALGGFPQGRDQTYAEWLAKRANSQKGCLIEPQDVVLHDFQKTRVFRKAGSSGPVGTDAVLRGIMTVTNPGEFNQLIAHGLGRHRAYGYGMILLRPPVKPTR